VPSFGNPNRSTAAKVLDPFGLIPGTNGAQNSNASYAKPKQPSTLQKMTSGTKKMASQTADFLNPFDDGPPKVEEQRLTGNNSIFNGHANPRKTQATESKSWLPNWFGSAPPPEKRPKTVNDFLSQERLQP
jgi:hypothetical protein